MKPDRIVLVLAVLLLAAGFVAWGAQGIQSDMGGLGFAQAT